MHLKRLAAPRFWPIHRKKNVFTLKPRAGSFAQEKSLSMGVALREAMKLTKNQSETKHILNEHKILLNGKACTDSNHPVGLMDVITVVPTGNHYRALPNKFGLYFKETKKADAFQLLKVVGKRQLSGTIQYSFHNGSTIVSKEKYTLGDTVKFKDGKPSGQFAMSEGNQALITAGSKVGTHGKIHSIKPGDATHPSMVKIESGKELNKTVKDYIFVIGKDKLEVEL